MPGGVLGCEVGEQPGPLCCVLGPGEQLYHWPGDVAQSLGTVLLLLGVATGPFLEPVMGFRPADLGVSLQVLSWGTLSP